VAGFVRLPLQRIVLNDLKNWLVFRENQFFEGPVERSFTVLTNETIFKNLFGIT
jgi:hypothetical protein